jgi:hypothetical protein
MAESTYKMAARQSALKACIFSVGVFDLAVSVRDSALQALVLQRISLHDDVVATVVEFDVSDPKPSIVFLNRESTLSAQGPPTWPSHCCVFISHDPFKWAQFAESFGPSQIALTGFFLGHPSD